MNRPLLVFATILVFSLGAVNARAMTPDAQAASATFNRQVETIMPASESGFAPIEVNFADNGAAIENASSPRPASTSIAAFFATAVALAIASLALGLAIVGLKTVWVNDQADLMAHDPLLRSDA